MYFIKNITLITLFALTLNITPALAEETPDCDFTGQLEELSNIQKNPVPDYLLQLRTELKVRREVLNMVLSCSIRDAQRLKTNLSGIPTENDENASIKNRLLEQADGVLAYYNLQKPKIAELGVYGTKEFSKNLKDWRAAKHDSLTQKTANFIIWNKNQEIFRTTEDRFAKIGQTIKILKLTENEEVKKLFADASQKLHDAKEENDKVKKLLAMNENPSETLDTIKSSLASLAKTYEIFFDLSEAVKKLLPH